MSDVCEQHGRLEQSIEKLIGRIDKVLERLGNGDVSFENLRVRVEHLERVVYGLMWMAGTTTVGLMVVGALTAYFALRK
jgi:hypothetical protein